jgi:sugar/nucleoside kinase (ribokinase family)
MKIVCIGQSTLDICMPLDQPITENVKFRVYDKVEAAGGPSTNASILLGKWGEDVTLFSRLGEDIYATHIKESLNRNHVKHHSIPCVNFETPISVILTSKANGNRTIFNCPGKIDPTDFSVEGQYDLFLSDGHEPELAHRFLDQHPTIVSILDAGGYRQPTVELAKRVTWLVTSEDFAEGYSGINIDINDETTWRTVFNKLHELNTHPIVTLGHLGCLYEEEGIIHHLPAFIAKAIDTNGAGDIFHGAFVYGLAHHLSLREILTLASMTSSISVTRRTVETKIPLLQEVLDRLNQEKGSNIV